MKVIILITVCGQHPSRIQNQINNFKGSLIVNDVEFVPVFVFGKGDNVPTDIPFRTMVVDVEEKYTNLYKKIFEAFKELHNTTEYDFICKIDDDTKINIDRFKKSLVEGYDYIGRIFEGGGGWTARITMDIYKVDIHHVLYEGAGDDFINTQFNYATGDCYFLSRRAIECILLQENEVKNYWSVKGDERVREDGFFGYLLHGKGLSTKNICYFCSTGSDNKLQLTENLFSIHPINDVLFKSMIGMDANAQLIFLDNNKTLNLYKRKIYSVELAEKIKQVIADFLNSKKTIGLG